MCNHRKITFRLFSTAWSNTKARSEVRLSGEYSSPTLHEMGRLSMRLGLSIVGCPASTKYSARVATICIRIVFIYCLSICLRFGVVNSALISVRLWEYRLFNFTCALLY